MSAVGTIWLVTEHRLCWLLRGTGVVSLNLLLACVSRTGLDLPVASTTPTPPVVAPTCTDGNRNGSETGIDCGGTCPSCADGQGCASAADCLSGACAQGKCATSPADTALPALSGTVLVGQTLSADTGTWSGTPPISR